MSSSICFIFSQCLLFALCVLCVFEFVRLVCFVCLVRFHFKQKGSPSLAEEILTGGFETSLFQNIPGDELNNLSPSLLSFLH